MMRMLQLINQKPDLSVKQEVLELRQEVEVLQNEILVLMAQGPTTRMERLEQAISDVYDMLGK